MPERLSTGELVDLLRGRLAEAVDSEKRLEIMRLVTDGWCQDCGSEEPKDANGYTRYCSCMNDE